jgi:5-methylcytosine-specific restriction enzyme subunit McrC
VSEFPSIGHLGEPISPDADGETRPPNDPLVLEEHKQSEPFSVNQADAAFLETLDERFETAPLDVSFTRDGLAILETGSHVGVATLPSGLQVEVRPKRNVTRLLWLLQYAFDVPVDALDLETDFAAASSFFDAIGVLFHAELQTVLARGLHRDYTRRRKVSDSVQGRIDVQRQLQRPSPVTTDFALEYDDFSEDTLLNRSVLAALRVLRRLVRDDTLAGRLHHQQRRLEDFVTVEAVPLASVERIELSRLNDHYAVLLELTKTILAREFYDDITAGRQRSLALFVDMNTVFERLVERAFEAATREIGGLYIERQASIRNVVEGPHAVAMRPDVLITRRDGTAVTVVDAKWKDGSVTAGDVYQLTSYILALEVPGAIVYPDRAGLNPGDSVVMERFPLRSVDLATNEDVSSYDGYVEAIEDGVVRYLRSIDGVGNCY